VPAQPTPPNAVTTLGLDPVEITKQLLRSGHFGATVSSVTAAMAEVDADALVAKHAPRVTYERWDERTWVNGVDPVTVKREHRHIGGPTYLVRLDQRVVLIQPFVPGAQGFVKMGEDDWEDHARAHAEQMVKSLAAAEVIAHVREKVATEVPQ